MGDDSELQNRMEDLKAQMEILDTTMIDVGTKVDTLDVSMGIVDTSINDLITALNSMSSKYVTPENTDEVVSPYSAKFGMIDFGNSYTLPGTTSGPLAYDGALYFYSVNGTSIVKWKLGDVAFTTLVAALPDGLSGFAITYDTTNDHIIVGEEPVALWGGGVSGRVWTYDTGGILIHDVTISNPVMAPLEEAPNALAYDADNDIVYLVYWGAFIGESLIGARFGKLNVSTGAITDWVDIPYNFAENSAKDAEFYGGVLYISYSSGSLEGLMGFDPVTGNARFSGGIPDTGWFYFDIDDSTKSWYFWDSGSANFKVAGLAHVQRVSLHDSDITVPISAASLPLPTGAAISASQTTMITALQKIDDLQNALRSIASDVLITQIEEAGSIDADDVAMTDAQAEIVAARADRKGLLIQNVDTTDTVWVGPTGVAIGTGIELLPKQSMVLNHYTGSTASIYGICDTGKTANIRFLEAF